MASATILMTTADLLALPDNGTERELIRGELRERPMTRRNRYHSGTEANTAYFLGMWLRKFPLPRMKVYSGEVGCILRRDPDTTFGIDVALVSAEMAARTSDDTEMLDGPPLLAVEILSPNDKLDEVEEKIDEYLAAGVALVWIINPYRRTVMVYRPNAEPELFNVKQELACEPTLPGFRVAVAALFE